MSKENNIVAVDFETAYDGEYSLSKMSVANYVKDPRFDAYLVSVDDGEDIKYVGRPEGFDWTLLDGKTIAMHNASFDVCVLARIAELGKIPRMPLGARYVCTADLAAWLGVKRDLKSASFHLLGEEVSKATRTAMMGKRSADLQNDADVLKYAGEDARLCYAIAARYLKDWPDSEQRISELNRESGIRGIHTDVALIGAGIATLEPQLQAAVDKIPWVKDGDKPLSPNALRKHGLAVGIPVPASLAKDNPAFLAWAEEYSGKYPWVQAVGEYRSINALLCKVRSIRDGVDAATGMLPFGIKYFGAATGRFSGGAGEGGGRFNCQNLPRKPMYGVDLRPMFMARPGHTFVIADYSQVEARFLLFVAGDTDALKPCAAGRSVYQAYAEKVGICTPEVNLKKVDPYMYSYVKAKILGSGYQCGGPKFRAFARLYGIKLTDEEAASDIAEFRKANPKIVQFWHAHQDALAYSARRKDDTHQIELRNGRVITYWSPRICGREISVYQTRGANRTFLYGGKCVENLVQASCRDILCDAWLAIDKAGLPPVTLTVHDEIVMEVRKDEAAQIAKELEKCMVTCSPWAEGLPLAVELCITDRYTK